MKKYIAILFTTLGSFSANSQWADSDSINILKLKKIISVLAHDSMGGRPSGSDYEKKSAAFIISEMKNSGIAENPAIPNYKQPFTFTMRKILGEKNESRFVYENNNYQNYKIEKDYWVLPYSANGVAFSKIINMNYGIHVPEENYSDYTKKDNITGAIFLIRCGVPNDINPHSKVAMFDIADRIREAEKRGASAVVFVNPGDEKDNPDTILSTNISPTSIPVIFVKDTRLAKGFLPPNSTFFVKTDIQKQELTGNNVVGFIDNHQKYYIIIGAHYDHLGSGEISGSLYKEKEKKIHNGADDNASGVAGLLLLAEELKINGPKNYNYIFSAFSGEEMGLFGSASLVKNLPVNLGHINCMINFDMIGRLDTVKNQLAVNGTGTSPAWSCIDSIDAGKLVIKKSLSGIGPSDHTSFYKENIPVLHFFTGNHIDYHKPSDDEKYINYKGELEVLKYVYKIIEKINDREKIKFSKTVDATNDSLPRFKVSLGIMPDYMYDGKGVRADAISEGKPAQKAGVQKGDVIIKLGDYDTNDMISYTKALSHFAKGDTTEVKVLRGTNEMVLKISF